MILKAYFKTANSPGTRDRLPLIYVNAVSSPEMDDDSTLPELRTLAMDAQITNKSTFATNFWLQSAASEPFENFSKPSERSIEAAQGAMQSYFSLLETTTSASPWSTNLNKKLLSYATQNISAAFELAQNLTQTNNLEDVIEMQVEFMSRQLKSFNEQAKYICDICTEATECSLVAASAAFKTAEAVTKIHSMMSH